MLIAKLRNGEIFSLLEQKRMEQIKQGERFIFYCPACQKEMILKNGEINVPHFAHKQKQACNVYLEPESENHLNGKLALHNWLHDQSLCPQVEYYFPKIKQRADLYVLTSSYRVAFEFQCSPITAIEIQNRTSGYKSIHVKVGWILGKYPTGINFSIVHQSQNLRLSFFQWSLLQYHKALGFYLLLFHPARKLVTFVYDFEYLTSKYTKATVHHHPLHELTYPFQFHKKRVIRSNIRYFLLERKQWIERKIYRDYTFKDPFLLAVYLDKVYLHRLTPYIGLPVSHAIHCHNHYIEWQYYLWKDVLMQQSEITIAECVQAFNRRVQNKDIHIRIFPLVLIDMTFAMIEEYLDILIRLGLMTKLFTKEHTYRISPCLSITNSQDNNVKIEQSIIRILN